VLAFLLQAGQLNGLTKSDCGVASASPNIHWHSIGLAACPATCGDRQSAPALQKVRENCASSA
jgi:hypothetical protein